MKQKNMSLKIFYFSCALSPILLLSGCSPFDWVKDKLSGSKAKKTNRKYGKKSRKKLLSGEWIVKVGDETVVSSNTFEKEFKMLLEEKPQLKSMLPLMPNLEKDFAKGLGNQEVITRYIDEKGLMDTPEYIAKKERMEKAIVQMINTEFFAESFGSSKLTDVEVKKFYEENKDTMQGILISQGGVNAKGISFKKKTDAEEFYKKAKSAGSSLNLEKLAKNSGRTERVQDFNLVNNQSFGVEPVVRSRILSLKKFPSVEMVAVGDKSFWVVYAKDKKETLYHPFEQIKDGIRNVAEQTAKGKLLQVELEKLSQTYNVKINEDYFQKKTVKAEIDTTGSVKAIDDAVSKALEKLPRSKTV